MAELPVSASEFVTGVGSKSKRASSKLQLVKCSQVGHLKHPAETNWGQTIEAQRQMERESFRLGNCLQLTPKKNNKQQVAETEHIKWGACSIEQ